MSGVVKQPTPPGTPGLSPLAVGDLGPWGPEAGRLPDHALPGPGVGAPSGCGGRGRREGRREGARAEGHRARGWAGPPGWGLHLPETAPLIRSISETLPLTCSPHEACGSDARWLGCCRRGSSCWGSGGGVRGRGHFFRPPICLEALRAGAPSPRSLRRGPGATPGVC